MMPFFLRHYSTFADKIVVWDEQSTDGTREMVTECPVAELREWPFRGLDDEKFVLAQNHWWKPDRGRFDWVMWPDVDELLFHPAARTLLEKRQRQGFDLIPAWGYAMIPPHPPANDGRSQFYDLCRQGVPTPNYNKTIIWNPRVNPEFDYGRHYLRRQVGNPSPVADFRLFHCHFLGADYTRMRNARNRSRVLDPRFAWNYAPEHDRPSQAGTPSWLAVQKPIDVVSNDWPKF